MVYGIDSVSPVSVETLYKLFDTCKMADAIRSESEVLEPNIIILIIFNHNKYYGIPYGLMLLSFVLILCSKD